MPNTRLTQGLCQPHVSPRSFEIHLGCTWDTSGHFVTKRSTSENLSLHQNKHATNGRLKRGRSFWRSYLNAVRILVRIFSKFGPNLYRSWPKSSKLFQMDTNYTQVFHWNGTEWLRFLTIFPQMPPNDSMPRTLANLSVQSHILGSHKPKWVLMFGEWWCSVSGDVRWSCCEVRWAVFVRLRETSVEIGNFAEFWMPTSARFQTVWECYKNFQTSGKFGDF